MITPGPLSVPRCESAALPVLCSVLAHLAHVLLEAGSWWSGGAQDLAAFLCSAVPLLPEDNRSWPRVLSTSLPLLAGPPAAAQLLILILTYLRAVAGR